MEEKDFDLSHILNDEVSVAPTRYIAVKDCSWQIYLRDIKQIPRHDSQRFSLPGKIFHGAAQQFHTITGKNPNRFKDLLLSENSATIISRLFLSLVPSHFQEEFLPYARTFARVEAGRIKRILEVVPRSEAWEYYVPIFLEVKHIYPENYVKFIVDGTLKYPPRFFDADEFPEEMRSRHEEYCILDYKRGNPAKPSEWRFEKAKKQITFEGAFIDTMPKVPSIGRVIFYRGGEEYVFPISSRSCSYIKRDVPQIRKMIDLASFRFALRRLEKMGLKSDAWTEDLEMAFHLFWRKNPGKYTCGFCSVRYHCFRKAKVDQLIDITLRRDSDQSFGNSQIETN